MFSGNKSTGLSYVPSLFQSCIRVLQQNIDGISITKPLNIIILMWNNDFKLIFDSFGMYRWSSFRFDASSTGEGLSAAALFSREFQPLFFERYGWPVEVALPEGIQESCARRNGVVERLVPCEFRFLDPSRLILIRFSDLQRCHEEREARLKSLTSKNKSAMATATPVRTTKLTYIESVAKNPRGSTKVWLTPLIFKLAVIKMSTTISSH